MHQHIHHKNDQESGHSGSLGVRMFLSVVLNALITVAEIIGGLLSNSIALLSDAVHNFSDTLSIAIAWIASRISGRDSNQSKTFGYKRIEILTALFNSVTLLAICFYLIYESIGRFIDPEPVEGGLMFAVALIGLFANLVSVIMLFKDKKSSLNIRSAYLHLIGDTFSSVAVVVGAILIYYYNIYWIDPVITILVCLYLLKESFVVTKEAVDILMQSSPSGISLEIIEDMIKKFENIKNVHHIHIWKLDDRNIHFECHIEFEEDIALSKTTGIIEKIESELKAEFGISHTTFQSEFSPGHADCVKKIGGC